MVWTYYESFAGRDVPFPSYADLGYLLAVPLLVTGLLLLSSGPRHAAGVARTVLDGLVVATALLLVSWEVVLNNTLKAVAHHDAMRRSLAELRRRLESAMCFRTSSAASFQRNSD